MTTQILLSRAYITILASLLVVDNTHQCIYNDLDLFLDDREIDCFLDTVCYKWFLEPFVVVFIHKIGLNLK